MAKGRVSKRSVDALVPGDRDQYLWDTELSGFGLKVTPAGHKTYLVQYRMGGRKTPTRRVSVGAHGVLTPDLARHEAAKVLGKITLGIDPAEEQAIAKRALTVAEMCDRYLEEGCADSKTSTVEKNRSIIKRHVKPLIGRKHVKNLTKADMKLFRNNVARGKTAVDERTGFRGRARVRGGKTAANRTLALLSQIMTFAADDGQRSDNPVLGVKRFKTDVLERFLSSLELARLGDTLNAAAAAGVNIYAISALRLLLLTGCRKNEVLTLKWEYVDWGAAAALRLPDSKTDAKRVRLGAPALELLSSIPRVVGNPYVFPSEKTGRHIVGLQKTWERLRAEADLADVRLHDLRHSFASVGADSGSSLLIIGKLLGHKSHTSTARYSHLSDDPVRAAAEKISGRIADAMKGNGDAKVVPLRQRN